MQRKYPEEVSAKMVRIIDGKEILLLRDSTIIRFGTSIEHLGMVVMTNPGKFEFRKIPGWEQFKNGEGSSDIFESVDYPDLSMRNVIKVIRSGFKVAGLGEPNGIVRIFNVSNIRQPDGEMAESYHSKALRILHKLKSSDLHVLEDPVTHSKNEFIRVCENSNFVMMGFVNGVFEEKVRRILDWSENIKRQRVCAIDNKGRYSHPRRWITESYLMDRAIESMATVLKG